MIEYYLKLKPKEQFLIGAIVLFIIVSLILIVFILISRSVKNFKEERSFNLQNFYQEYLLSILFEEDAKLKINQLAKLKSKINSNFKKAIIVNELLELNKNLKGEIRGSVLHVYETLDLSKFLGKQIKSRKWNVKAIAIRNLSLFEDGSQIHIISKSINHSEEEVRNEANFALVRLQGVTAFGYLHAYKYTLNTWQQLRLIELVKEMDLLEKPNTALLLKSDNLSIVSFAIKLVYYFNDGENVEGVFNRVKELKSISCHIDALDVFIKFQFEKAIPFYIEVYKTNPESIQVKILEFVKECSFDDANLPFLIQQFVDANYKMKLKILEVVNYIDESWIQEIEVRDKETFEVMLNHVKDDRI